MSWIALQVTVARFFDHQSPATHERLSKFVSPNVPRRQQLSHSRSSRRNAPIAAVEPIFGSKSSRPTFCNVSPNLSAMVAFVEQWRRRRMYTWVDWGRAQSQRIIL